MNISTLALLRKIGLGLTLTVIVLSGAALGWRPVVIQTGSMGDAAPQGSLVLAAPAGADDVAVGDVLIMRRPGAATVTHRVVQIEERAGARVAITKGDANSTVDPDPYPMAGEQLVARKVVPGGGFAVRAFGNNYVVMALVVGAAAMITTSVLRRIWGVGTHGAPVGAASATTDSGDSAPSAEDEPAWPWAVS